jgi:hypothetical protein
MFMLDEIVMSPPEELDGEEWKAWVVRAKFITDIVRAVDALEDPAKYESKQPQPPADYFPHVIRQVR